MTRFRTALWTAGTLFFLAGCGESDEQGPTEPGNTELLRAEARPLTGAPGDYDPLMNLVGDAHFVLLGEASHGTHEFYRERARITRRLIEEKGFTAVAIEGDWPDAYRVNRYVRGVGQDASAEQALSEFNHFPQWMWNNTDVRDLVQSLRTLNAARPTAAARVGFYGLDVYSPARSREEVIRYLESVDPAAAQRARTRYAAKEQFADLERRYKESGPAGLDDLFSAVQNARVVMNGEEYFNAGGSWNVRDRHMVQTLDALAAHLQRTTGRPGRIVVWAHNSHVGDARATEMGRGGQWNIGQLVRERHPGDAVLVGFTTHTGTVRAASQWEGAATVKQVRPSLSGSYEALFHQVGIPNFLLVLRGTQAGEELRTPRLERAIGVIYLPESERASHYFDARLADQFDAVIHWDETRAVEPLGR